VSDNQVFTTKCILFNFFLALTNQQRYITIMTIKDNGKEFHFERLSNGLLRTYDYACAWDVTFKKINGKWEGWHNGGYIGYKSLLNKLNLLQQQVDAEMALTKDLQEVI
jgi:hypothetical protein